MPEISRIGRGSIRICASLHVHYVLKRARTSESGLWLLKDTNPNRIRILVLLPMFQWIVVMSSHIFILGPGLICVMVVGHLFMQVPKNHRSLRGVTVMVIVRRWFLGCYWTRNMGAHQVFNYEMLKNAKFWI